MGKQGKYVDVRDGVEFELEVGKIVKHRCCDCGLVHDAIYEVRGKRAFVTYRRNARATSQVRRRGANMERR